MIDITEYYEEFMAFYSVGDYLAAGSYFVGLLQDMKSDPVVFLDYQPASFAHFFGVYAKNGQPFSLEAFEYFLKMFAHAAHQGYLPDMRAKDN